MGIAARKIELRKVDVATRMPFRYGIATLTEAPYLLVFVDFEIDGARVRGVAADFLPPKWFTKNPDALFEDEIADLLTVVRRAGALAVEQGAEPSVFQWWRQLYNRQMSDPAIVDWPPLLKGFGVSLLERAAIDAFCRRYETTLAGVLQQDLLGIRLGELHEELAGARVGDLLPQRPTSAMHVRHTVGLADPLTAGEIAPEERLNDGLPQSLDQCLKYYGLKYLKIKLPAEVDSARARLLSIRQLVESSDRSVKFTLDGNEFFDDAQTFRVYWEQLAADPELQRFFQTGLLVVEQPLHRDVALSEDAGRVFADWPDHPPIIIDESDGELGSLRQALATGYAGTSHKNCKGVIKGLASGCLVNFLNRREGASLLVMTGEDLMNIGPVALQQDLAVGAILGLTHMERNGHHFVAGLNQFPSAVQEGVLRSHADLYQRHELGESSFATLAVQDGKIELGSVNRAPFGYALELDSSRFELVDTIE